MNLQYFPANSRGEMNFGWLQTAHSYSFGHYWNPERMGFGALRVINDDLIAPGQGFGRHHHNDMEIITIPLSGILRHTDSMGNEGDINHSEVQAMSAGTTIIHSEMNPSTSEPVSLFQIWILTKEKGIKPQYSQKSFEEAGRKQQWQLVAAPMNFSPGTTSIHQDAWINLGDFTKGSTATYTPHNKESGIALMVIEGEAQVGAQILQRRDMIEVTGTDTLEITTNQDTSFLLIEVPMEIG